MIVDEAVITVKAGDGGDGAVSFRREKYVQKGGPDGGNGGDGGEVYIEGVADLSALKRFRYQKEFEAENGGRGMPKKMSGKNGKDLVLKVPVGTVIVDKRSNERWDISKIGEPLLIAIQGKGGRGNWHFRSPSNTTPKQFERGGWGQKRILELELQLIADVGFIGLPNAGKSSLLNELTRASVRVADYPFTTLEPNLGAMPSFAKTSDGKSHLILADIPGLIEGASGGKGLGIKFLRHIRRTKVLVHCISAESNDVARDYQIVRQELKQFDPELLKKKELVVLTKVDLVNKKTKYLPCSIYRSDLLTRLKLEVERLAL